MATKWKQATVASASRLGSQEYTKYDGRCGFIEGDYDLIPNGNERRQLIEFFIYFLKDNGYYDTWLADFDIANENYGMDAFLRFAPPEAWLTHHSVLACVEQTLIDEWDEILRLCCQKFAS